MSLNVLLRHRSKQQHSEILVVYKNLFSKMAQIFQNFWSEQQHCLQSEILVVHKNLFSKMAQIFQNFWSEQQHYLQSEIYLWYTKIYF